MSFANAAAASSGSVLSPRGNSNNNSIQAQQDCSQLTVKLNVGGKVFYTTKETLLNNSGGGATLYYDDQNFFHKLLSLNDQHVNIAKDETGAYVIDRNPALFGIILEYLRTGNALKTTY